MTLQHENRNLIIGTQEEAHKKRDTTFIKKYDDKKAGFCQKCGAWLGQLGLESTPEAYIAHLTEIFNEVKRVLKKEGTLWLNIGDTYWGGKGKSGYELPHEAEKRRQKGETIQHSYNVPGYMEMRPPDGKHDFIQPKCLTMIPERLTWSLIQKGWILRNKIPWIKPNCMPSSAKDRYTNKWEYVFYFVKSKRNYFDLESIREPHKTNGDYKSYKNKLKISSRGNAIGKKYKVGRDHQEKPNYPSGKNPGDVWVINTVPCPVKGIHFATFPEELCRKAIMPGCPEEVCRKCGQPREKLYKPKFSAHDGKTKTSYDKKKSTAGRLATLRQAARERGDEYQNEREFIGYKSCKCDAGFEPGIVLDPFCGIGTACLVAKKMGRRYIGIEIKDEYIKAAEEQIGRWLF